MKNNDSATNALISERSNGYGTHEENLKLEKQSRWHPARAPFRWTMLLLSTHFSFAAYFADVTIGSTAPMLTNDLGLTTTQVGILMSAIAFPSLVLSPLAGIVVDKIGTNWTSLFFTTMNFIGSLIFAMAPNFEGKLVGALVLGTGFEPLGIVQDGIVARWFMWSEGEPVSPSVPLAYGVMFTGTLLGQFLGMIFMPLVSHYNLLAALLLPAGLLFTSVCANVIFVVLDRQASPVLGLDVVDEDAEEFSIKHIRHFPLVFWLLSFIALVSYSQVWILMTFSTDYVHDEFNGQYNASTAAWINSIMFAVPLFLSPFVGLFLQKTGCFLTTMTAGAIFLVIGEGLLAVQEVNPIISMVVIGLAYCLVPAAVWPMINMVVREDMVATAFGVATFVMALGGTIGPFVIGYLAHQWGSYTYPFLILAGVAMSGVVLCLCVILIEFYYGSSFSLQPDGPDVADVDEEQCFGENYEDEPKQRLPSSTGSGGAPVKEPPVAVNADLDGS